MRRTVWGVRKLGKLSPLRNGRPLGQFVCWLLAGQPSGQVGDKLPGRSGRQWEVGGLQMEVEVESWRQMKHNRCM